MKLKVFSVEGLKEPEVTLRLLASESGVILQVVDDKGMRVSGGDILKIRSTGEIHLFKGVAPALGFIRDPSGRVVSN